VKGRIEIVETRFILADFLQRGILLSVVSTCGDRSIASGPIEKCSTPRNDVSRVQGVQNGIRIIRSSGTMDRVKFKFASVQQTNRVGRNFVANFTWRLEAISQLCWQFTRIGIGEHQ